MAAGAHPIVHFQPTRRDLMGLAGLLGVSLIVPAAHAATAATFSAPDLGLIGEVAELIIPATDTGGAKAAGVPQFIDMMVAKWFDPDERAHFISEMAAFDKGAVGKFGKRFTALAPEEKTRYFGDLLMAAEAAPQAPSDPKAPPKAPFVVLMKRLTVFGYYTSELGASVELSLDMVPNQYLPNAPLKPGERADSFILFQLQPLSAR